MKKKLMMLAPFALMLLTGCFTVVSGNNSVKNGDESDATVKKEIKIGDFNEVVASQSIQVIFVQGENSGKATIATTPSAEKYLKVEVTDNKLRAYYDMNRNGVNVKIKGPSIVRISSPSLTNVDLSSGAEFKVNGNINLNEDFNIGLSSGAEFETKGNINCKGEVYLGMSSASSFEASIIECESLKIDASSGADVEVKSLTGDLNVSASSGSDVEIDAVKAQAISLGASSGSDIDVANIIAQEINAKASSGADIALSGKTNALTQNSSSGGSIKTKGLKVN